MQKNPQSGLKLSQLRALAAVADYGTFAEAAYQLGITQPTVSHAIANLEEELGITLLTRGRHGAYLTPAGEKIVGHVREVLNRLDQITQEASLHRGLQGGEVRIATFRSAAAYLLPQVVAQFQQDCPAIAINISEHYDFTFVEQEVRDGKADIGFTFLPTAPDLETIEVLRDSYLVLLPPDFAWDTPQITWEALTQLPLILYSEDNSCFAAVRDYFTQAGYSLKPRYQFRETSTILNMVAQGMGASILPQLSVVMIPNGLKLVQLPIPLERQVGVAIRAGALHPPPVFAFLSVLRQMLPTLSAPLDRIGLEVLQEGTHG
jgi:DNA-binding transcriptional LysR family regulator